MTGSGRIKQESADDGATSQGTMAHSRFHAKTVPQHPSRVFHSQFSHSNGTTTTDVNMGDENGHAATDGIASKESDAMDNLGQDSRQLILVIQRLETLCIDTTLPSLPKFIVIGDQSAGKSSIVEAVCDITVPRDNGTCTRCPYQITTTASNTPWKCSVTLHCKYKHTPSAGVGMNGQKGSEYNDWTEQDSLNPFPFATVDDKNDLEEVLRRAQLAILNPEKSPETFLYTNVLATPRLGFSPNVVSLEIEGPGLPELSFFDLPGAINVVQDDQDQDHLVNFIKRLLKHYLRDEKALVLLACSANQDIEISTAFRFVRECKAINRCMGVLTKPDLLERNRIEYIRRVLNGDTFKLSNRWFVTKQLSQEELAEGCTYREARMREMQFFSTDPWHSGSLGGFRERFGTLQLQSAISQKLTAHILNDLPKIIARVDNRLTEVCAQIREFPQPVQSASHTVKDEIHNVTDLINSHIRGDGLDNEFRADCRQLVREMRTQLKDIRPQIVLATPGYEKPSILIDSEDDGNATPAHSGTPFQTPSKMRKGNNGKPISTPQRRAALETSLRSETESKREPAEVECAKAIFDLGEVKLAFDRGSSSGIPDQIDPKVTEHFIKRCLVGWRDIVNELLCRLRGLLTATLTQTIQQALATRRQTQLFASMSECIVTFVTGLLEDQEKVVMHIVDCEVHKPISYNLNLKGQTEAIRTKLYRDRLSERIDEHLDVLESRGSKRTNKQDRNKKLDDSAWCSANLRADEYSREVSAMATIFAYYDIASARMVDTIANHLEYGLMFTLQTKLLSALRADLAVQDQEHCARLLAEDPQREALRARLLVEKEKLLIAMEELRTLPQRN